MFKYRLIFFSICMSMIAISVQAEGLSHRVVSHVVQNTTVDMQLIENRDKKGLTYFLTGTVSPHTEQVIKHILTLYGGKAYWLLTPSVDLPVADPIDLSDIHENLTFVKKNGNTFWRIPLSYIHFVGGRYAWKSLPDDLPEAEKKTLLQIADWVQYKIGNGYNSSADIVIVHTPSMHQGMDMITTNRQLYKFSKMVGFDVNKIVDPKPYRNMTIIYNMVDSPKSVQMLQFINRFYGVGLAKRNVWRPLTQGAIIDLVAPSSAYPESYVDKVVRILEKRGFIVRTKYLQQEKQAELHYSNTTEKRFSQLVQALNDPDSDAVWIMRGGGGTTNILPYLLNIAPPKISKPFIGFSDSTSIHMFMNTHWNMPTIHGVVAQYNHQMNTQTKNLINKDANIDDVINILMGQSKRVAYTHLQPLNSYAMDKNKIQTRILGGNLTLANALHGGMFYVQSDYQTTYSLLLEGIGNGLHQMERMLDALLYSRQLQQIDAIILGDFVSYDPRINTKKYRDLLDTVVQRFADKSPIPVFRLRGVGHDSQNHPIPLNTKTTIQSTPEGTFSITIDAR